jgi:hypothetical protein
MQRAPDDAAAQQAILELLAARAPGATICPSEAARRLAGDDDFQPLMPRVRDAAQRLVERGAIEVTQRGEPVELATARGPIRLRAVSDDATA